jgi:hypothetical protein
MDGELLNDADFSECNFLGGNLSQLTIRFADGISQRWNHITTDRLQYRPVRLGIGGRSLGKH